jgi:hypothetical protein
VVHVIHIPAVIVSIVIPFDIRVLNVLALLVVPDHVLHVADSDAKNNVDAVLKLTLAENLVLVQHFKVATEGEKTVTASLMLRADAAAANLIAEFGQSNVFQRGNIFYDVFEVVYDGKVHFHRLVEVIN